MGRVEGKVAAITGAASGIGKETAILMAKEGARVAVLDLQEEDGKKVVQEINNNGGKAQFWKLDVSDEAQVKKVFSEIVKEYGEITVLVNNAGILGENKPPHEIGKEEWDKVLAVNVIGVALCTKHAIPYMKKAGKGSIVNLSSIYGIVGKNDNPPYHASKGAVRIMSKTDAIYYAKDKIRVNSVHPGFIWTNMVQAAAEDSPVDVEDFRKAIAKRHPVGHVGEPRDIAYGILYLASDESKFVTGSELVIDGGYTAQ
jgi:NAD(P)-dependent dehydrogenase (short-subunit alcohol dehydrogenase family)